MNTSRFPNHGTYTRHYAYGCHCTRCLTSPTVIDYSHRLAVGLATPITPEVDLTAPHDHRRYRDLGCRCDTCTIDYADHRRDVKTSQQKLRDAEAAKRRRQRENARNYRARQAAAAALEANAPNPWRFEQHALHQAHPVGREVTPKSVICCEREAFEIEGSGHDWDCPQAAA